jgi:hypothetical protein
MIIFGASEMRRERRKHFRVEWNSVATIFQGKVTRPCIVKNFSNGGARIVGVVAATIPDEFALRITSHDNRIRRCRVLSRSDDELRVKFTDRIAEGTTVAKKLRERA